MDNLNSSQMLPVGTILDSRYRIEKYLASGGFGNTYVAFDTRFDCQVAVKEFFMRGTNHRSADHTTVVVSNAENREGFDAQLDKFRREAKRIFNMRNDHIVHVVDLFDTNGTSYYVMDLIEGESLKDRVKRRPLTEVEVRKIADQLLDALGAVHAAGFYHLDVKPGNIMMDKKGHCTLIDFGASKQMSAMDRTSMSASGMAYTPGYAPVEQESQRTKSIGPWTDFYAVGATLYNLLTGQTPPEIDPYDTAPDSRMFDYPDGVSPQMQRAISHMMNPDYHVRPQDAEHMRALLASEDIIVEIPVLSAENEETKEAPNRETRKPISDSANKTQPLPQKEVKKPVPHAHPVTPKKPAVPENAVAPEKSDNLRKPVNSEKPVTPKKPESPKKPTDVGKPVSVTGQETPKKSRRWLISLLGVAAIIAAVVIFSIPNKKNIDNTTAVEMESQLTDSIIIEEPQEETTDASVTIPTNVTQPETEQQTKPAEHSTQPPTTSKPSTIQKNETPSVRSSRKNQRQELSTNISSSNKSDKNTKQKAVDDLFNSGQSGSQNKKQAVDDLFNGQPSAPVEGPKPHISEE